MASFEPPCPGEANDSWTVDVNDILIVVGSWGTGPVCEGDVNDDGVVDTDDVLLIIANWGNCG